MKETLKDLEAKAEKLRAELDTMNKEEHPYHYNDTLAAWHKVLRKIKIAKKEKRV